MFPVGASGHLYFPWILYPQPQQPCIDFETASILCPTDWRGSQLCFPDRMDGHAAAVCSWARASQSTCTAEVGPAPGPRQCQKAAVPRCRKPLGQEGVLVSQSSCCYASHCSRIVLCFFLSHTPLPLTASNQVACIQFASGAL